jgi:hypothetical protein
MTVEATPFRMHRLFEVVVVRVVEIASSAERLAISQVTAQMEEVVASKGRAEEEVVVLLGLEVEEKARRAAVGPTKRVPSLLLTIEKMRSWVTSFL